ncbi:MAG: hypothetical protein ACE37H_10470 [Phycisphaeraceae bacterium]
MKCSACGSEELHLIKVFAGHNAMGWSPVGGEKDIFGNYKKLRPLLAHACSGCGNVMWNIQVPRKDPGDTARALDALASEETADAGDPGEDSVAYTLGEELA